VKDYSNYYPSHHDKMVSDSTRLFNIQINGDEGKDGYIDNVLTKFVFRKHSNTLNQFKGEYYVICESSLDFKKGSIVKVGDQSYLTMYDVEYDGLICKKGLVQTCNNILKFYKNNTLFQLPCIFTNGSIDMTDNKFMSLPSGHYNIFIKNDNIITKADLNLRFMLNGSAYKIEGINDSQNGLLKIEVVDDGIVVGDDNPDLNIANYYSNQKPQSPSTTGWTVSLTPTTEKLMLGRTLELTAHAYNNGVEDNTKFFLYTVTNEDGTSNNYVTTTILTNVCKLVAGTKSTYAGKVINIHCALLGDPTVYYDRKIKLVSF